MANIEEYLDWRGDIPFSLDPFNEIDNLILAELAYVPYDDIVPALDCPGFISIEEVSKYFLYHPRPSFNKTNNPFPLLHKVAKSPRFAKMKLAEYVSTIDEESVTQFCALTFFLEDFNYIAYRGTDNSMVGWKEDFLLSYRETEGQEKAAQYLNQVSASFNVPFYVGGHSKGGNLAIYAAAHCQDRQTQILQIYANDAPGFREDFLQTESFKSIADKITSIIPETSLVGILMHSVPFKAIVKSDAGGIYQHNPLSWEVYGHHFVETDKQSTASLICDETLTQWLQSVSYEERAEFIQNVFDALDSLNVQTFGEVMSQKWKSSSALASGFMKLDSFQQKQMISILLRLAKAGGFVLKKEASKNVSEALESLSSTKQTFSAHTEKKG